MLNVVVAEDSLLVREGLERLIDRHEDLSLTASVDGLPALEAVSPTRCRTPAEPE